MQISTQLNRTNQKWVFMSKGLLDINDILFAIFISLRRTFKKLFLLIFNSVESQYEAPTQIGKIWSLTGFGKEDCKGSSYEIFLLRKGIGCSLKRAQWKIDWGRKFSEGRKEKKCGYLFQGPQHKNKCKIILT